MSIPCVCVCVTFVTPIWLLFVFCDFFVMVKVVGAQNVQSKYKYDQRISMHSEQIGYILVTVSRCILSAPVCEARIPDMFTK